MGSLYLCDDWMTWVLHVFSQRYALWLYMRVAAPSVLESSTNEKSWAASFILSFCSFYATGGAVFTHTEDLYIHLWLNRVEARNEHMHTTSQRLRFIKTQPMRTLGFMNLYRRMSAFVCTQSFSLEATLLCIWPLHTFTQTSKTNSEQK